ncbi:hypothetical protein LR48_Vigan05g122500 [Vigna angularis]|uniref:Uncharacterized protein n=1 Tax=Phaseolus angularis TaxID=3914 RepID=A0A0L9UL48_PHAAN|nr:hypothetical protein LR48_Vigan05g122500 [Vigna angularis]
MIKAINLSLFEGLSAREVKEYEDDASSFTLDVPIDVIGGGVELNWPQILGYDWVTSRCNAYVPINVIGRWVKLNLPQFYGESPQFPILCVLLMPVTLLWIGKRKGKTRVWLHEKDKSSSDRLNKWRKKDVDNSLPRYNGIFGTKMHLVVGMQENHRLAKEMEEFKSSINEALQANSQLTTNSKML